ncbi:HU family DNA-binding protein [bacterium]|nr:HU family DNA-binding protein [bacterium]MBT3581840.1 HU family DNA-binding protein [bacterium]MBT4552603.1 HU family DNA-binding protein [bacterium]MBT5988461.1 HU family DNA-binding protein [bacterium]MBT7088579.1 HU family DNA-binding protein [bacterium]
MNKSELIDTLARNLGKRRTEIEKIVEATFDLIIAELSKGDSVRIVGFGNFEVRRRIAREGRNPLTGDLIQIKATQTPFFAPGKKLKDKVKGKR